MRGLKLLLLSGGLDSVHSLHEYVSRGEVIEAYHVSFRDQTSKWKGEDYCAKWHCDKLGVPLHTDTAIVPWCDGTGSLWTVMSMALFFATSFNLYYDRVVLSRKRRGEGLKDTKKQMEAFWRWKVAPPLEVPNYDKLRADLVDDLTPEDYAHTWSCDSTIEHEWGLESPADCKCFPCTQARGTDFGLGIPTRPYTKVVELRWCSQVETL